MRTLLAYIISGGLFLFLLSMIIYSLFKISSPEIEYELARGYMGMIIMSTVTSPIWTFFCLWVFHFVEGTQIRF